MKKKAYLIALIAILTMCIVLVFAQFAFATVVSPGSTGPQAGGASSTGGATTGAPMLILSGIGSALVGAGFLLRRRAAK